MKVSLVVATFGRSSELKRLFDSLADQTCSNFEVIVVDQNLDDIVVPYVMQGIAKSLDIKHVRLEKANLSDARNYGILLAKNEIIAFPDDDCWYDTQTIETVSSLFYSESKIDCIVGNWVEQTTGRSLQPYIFSRESWRKFRGGEASSITLFLRREYIEKLGGFDCKLGVGCWYGGAEETDLILRALESGAKILYDPSAKVHHNFNREPVGRILSVCRKARVRERGTGAIYAKHKLSYYVIIRGIVAPILLSIFRLNNFTILLRSAFVALGRLEGYLRWRLSKYV